MDEKVVLTKQELLDMLQEETYDNAFIAYLKNDNVHAQIVGSPNNVAKIFAGILIHDASWATSIVQGVYSAMVHLINVLETAKDDKDGIEAGEKITKIGPVFEELAEAIRKLGMDSAARAISQMLTDSKEGDPDGSEKSEA